VGYFIDFNIDLASITSGFEISTQERSTRDEALILNKLREWSAKAQAEFGTNKHYNFDEEFKAYGLLDRFYRKLQDGKVIDLGHMLSELLMQDTMAGIMTHIESNGMHSYVKNFDGAYFAIELTKCNMSFGQIYAFMESMKSRHFIKEYSCKLSSLEEIFNSHASESMFMELNKRIDRKRNSTLKSLQD